MLVFLFLRLFFRVFLVFRTEPFLCSSSLCGFPKPFVFILRVSVQSVFFSLIPLRDLEPRCKSWIVFSWSLESPFGPLPSFFGLLVGFSFELVRSVFQRVFCFLISGVKGGSCDPPCPVQCGVAVIQALFFWSRFFVIAPLAMRDVRPDPSFSPAPSFHRLWGTPSPWSTRCRELPGFFLSFGLTCFPLWCCLPSISPFPWSRKSCRMARLFYVFSS